MSLVQINWDPDARELRKFGVTMLVGFGLIGLALHLWPWGWPFHRNPGAALVCFGVGAAAGLLGLTGTRAALLFYWPWMGVAFVAGNIMSRILLGAFFYGMITPMGLVMRLVGRDRLKVRRKNRETYWEDIPPVADRSRYEHQF